jgi:hypothetical protein
VEIAYGDPMRSGRTMPRRDTWGKKPDDPFFRWLYADPGRAGRLSVMITVGMILFWMMILIGMILALVFIVTG